jgi:hypothetical protein
LLITCNFAELITVLKPKSSLPLLLLPYICDGAGPPGKPTDAVKDPADKSPKRNYAQQHNEVRDCGSALPSHNNFPQRILDTNARIRN